jgi:hypothetical protein
MKRLLTLINWNSELTAEEQLDNLKKETRKRNLVEDVLEIRRNGYVPNYDKPRLHTEYKLTDSNGNIVSSTITTTCERPEQFKSVEEWYTAMRTAFLSELEEKKRKELRDELWKLTVDVHFAPSLMRKMMKVE